MDQETEVLQRCAGVGLSLGVELQPLTPVLMSFMGLDLRAGGIVVKVHPDDDGAVTGWLMRGDVVIEVDRRHEEVLAGALAFEVIPEHLIRAGSGSALEPRWRVACFPKRGTLQEPGAAPAGDCELSEGAGAECFGLRVRDTPNGILIGNARVRTGALKSVYLREVAVKNGDGTLTFRRPGTVRHLERLWKEASADGGKEVMLAVSSDTDFTLYSRIRYVLVPLGEAARDRETCRRS